jgi:hypothetical protein
MSEPPFNSKSTQGWPAARPPEHNQCSALTKTPDDQIAQSADRIVSRPARRCFRTQPVSPRGDDIAEGQSVHEKRPSAGRNEVYADDWVTNIRGRFNTICPIPAQILKSFATR